MTDDGVDTKLGPAQVFYPWPIYCSRGNIPLVAAEMESQRVVNRVCRWLCVCAANADVHCTSKFSQIIPPEIDVPTDECLLIGLRFYLIYIYINICIVRTHTNKIYNWLHKLRSICVRYVCESVCAWVRRALHSICNAESGKSEMVMCASIHFEHGDIDFTS